MALNPHHDVHIGTHHQVGVHWDEEPFRDCVPHPPDEILRLVTREEFAANPVDAEDSALPVVMNHALPEAGADVERVIEVLRRDEDIRIHEIGPIHHQGRSTPSRLAYFWKVPPRSPVRS